MEDEEDSQSMDNDSTINEEKLQKKENLAQQAEFFDKIKDQMEDLKQYQQDLLEKHSNDQQEIPLDKAQQTKNLDKISEIYENLKKIVALG